MFNSITMKFNSVDFNEDETRILIKILNYMKENFRYGNGLYLDQINLDKIKFKWSNNMYKIKNDNKIQVYGAWSPLYFNEIYLCPNLYSNKFIDSYLIKDEYIKNIIKIIKEKYKKCLYENLYDETKPISKSHSFTILHEIIESMDLKEKQKYFNILLKFIDYEEEKIFYNFEIDIPIDKNNKYIIPIDIKRKIFPKSLTNYSQNKTILHNSWIRNLNKFNMILNFVKSEEFDLFNKNFYTDEFIEKQNELQNETGESPNIILGMYACHELYHKWQFSATKFMPILYITNSIVSFIIGYKNASLNKWFIEGDVRKTVDNPINGLEFLKLYNAIEYIRMAAGIFMMEKFSNDEKFCNYSENFKQHKEYFKIFFNNFFTNKFKLNENSIYEEKYKIFSKDFKKDDKSYHIDIKNSSEYKYMIKLMKEENVLTDEFLKFLEEI